MHRYFVFFLMFTCLGSQAQDEDGLFIRRLADEILVNGETYENLRVLCKTVGGRLAGSPQMHTAEKWAASALQEAGAGKVYLQQCLVPRWRRGGKDEGYISYKDKNGKTVKMELDLLALGNSLGTGRKGIEAPITLINNFEELENLKEEVKGKVVFYNHAFNPRYVETGRSYSESGVYRRSGPSRAAKYGALAVLTRSLTGAVDNNPHTGATAYDSLYPKIPAAAMGARDADKLARLINEGQKPKVYLKTMAQFLPDTVGNNVIGELKGSVFPDEIITVGGHLDSWDVAEGAHDDGAGCVQSIAVISAFRKLGYTPKRTIRVVLFANEENGLRGANKYAEEAKIKNEKHVFALESDAGGFTPRGFDISLSGEKLQKMREWLPLFTPYGVSQFLEGNGGADVGPLNSTMGTVVAGLRPDPQRYFDVHHARSDVFENVHKRELELGAINMAALIYLVDKYGL